MAKPARYELVEPLWERQEGESAAQFQAFRKYRDAGDGRTLRATSRQRTGNKKNAPGQIGQWSREWSWVERAAAYDKHLDRIAIREAEAVRAETARAWAQRREQDRENAWCRAHEIIGRLEVKLQAMSEEAPIRDYDQLISAFIKAYDMKGAAVLDALLDAPPSDEGGEAPGKGTAKVVRLVAPPRPERLSDH